MDIDNVGIAARVLLPHLQACIARGDLNWNLHSDWLDDIVRHMDAIASDAVGGYPDSHTAANVRRLISAVFGRYERLGLQRLR